jgi:hypothetical protein
MERGDRFAVLFDEDLVVEGVFSTDLSGSVSHCEQSNVGWVGIREERSLTTTKSQGF